MKAIATCWKRLKRDERGSAALEFSLMGPLFISMLLAIFELGYMILRIVTLDDAVAQASRFIYTGGAADGAVSRAQLEEFICDRAQFFNDCQNNIAIEARVISGFGSIPNDDATCEDSMSEEVTPAAAYSGGGSSEIMFLRVCVTTDMLFPLDGLGLNLDQTANGRIQVVSSTAFANEPF